MLAAIAIPFGVGTEEVNTRIALLDNNNNINNNNNGLMMTFLALALYSS